MVFHKQLQMFVLQNCSSLRKIITWIENHCLRFCLSLTLFSLSHSCSSFSLSCLSIKEENIRVAEEPLLIGEILVVDCDQFTNYYETHSRCKLQRHLGCELRPIIEPLFDPLVRRSLLWITNIFPSMEKFGQQKMDVF